MRNHLARIINSTILCAILFLLGAQVHATTVALSPVAKQQFLSAAGVPLAAGCIYTYAGGTTNFLATYVDSTGTTQNTDPIQLDSGGFANIWLTGVAFKFAVYSNPTGGACPGTPGGSLVLQYTVDNITTSTGSGSGAATSVVSAGANPATSGIIEMTKSDTVCWRNAGNSANVCASLDGANNLTWSGGSLALTEIAAPSGVSGEDLLWADSTAHRFKQSGNGGSAAQLVNAGADINTSDQVTVTHLSSALPVAQGGTGQTTLTGLPITNAALTTPTIGGTTITNVPSMTWGGTVPTNSFNASNTTSISAWTTLNPITIKAFYINANVNLSGCSPFPQWSIEDNGSGINTITLTASNAWSNTGLSLNVAAGHSLTVNETAGGTSCTTGGGVYNFTVVYQMQ